jgi:hypothetical protein
MRHSGASAKANSHAAALIARAAKAKAVRVYFIFEAWVRYLKTGLWYCGLVSWMDNIKRCGQEHSYMQARSDFALIDHRFQSVFNVDFAAADSDSRETHLLTSI